MNVETVTLAGVMEEVAWRRKLLGKDKDRVNVSLNESAGEEGTGSLTDKSKELVNTVTFSQSAKADSYLFLTFSKSL